MAFYIYDITFFVIFCLVIGIFLYRNRKNLKRDMKIAFLYRTQAGVKLINYVGDKYRRTLGVLKYFVIALGYILMAGIVYLIGKSLILYLTQSVMITKVIKAPPIAPVIPYFPELFGMKSFFPPFYFTYFIIALAVVAIVHEFSHGIYMRYNKVRIKSTGILFLGPILGAFVEQDDKDMEKASKTAQLSILGAGVFANVVTAIVAFLLWWLVFSVAFAPNGAIFNDYIGTAIKTTSIMTIAGINVTSSTTDPGLLELINNKNIKNDYVTQNNEHLNFTTISSNGIKYYVNVDILKSQLKNNATLVYVYQDLPAISEGVKGTIIGVDNKEIKDHKDLVNAMKNYRPEDKIELRTKYNDQVYNYNLALAKDPSNSSRAVIGIANVNMKMNIAENFAVFKDPFTDYQIRSEFLAFIYYLFFWLFLINVSVAFFNMLPASIFDGGRFFYLTVWAITKKEKVAAKAYKYAGVVILLVFVLMMVGWFFGIINR